MKRISFILVLFMIISSFGGASAQPPEAAYSGDTHDIEVNIESSGLRVATRIDDTTCQVGFMGLIASPTLDVYSSDDMLVSSTLLGIGDWSLVDDVAYCHTTLEVAVPVGKDFRVEIIPYYLAEYSAAGIDAGILDIELHREEGDPFPISPIPTGGPINGTENIRIIGHFQLQGENLEDFAVLPPLGCMGFGGYSDVQYGMQIIIKDETGAIVGVASLVADPTEDKPEDCKFYFVADVPESAFYTFESGRRGGITFSHDDVVENGYEVFLTVGR